jgi:hypothetical protein
VEPSPIRNNGPYISATAAKYQFQATTYGIPCDTEIGITLILREILMITRVLPSEFEEKTLEDISNILDPEMAQVIAG